MKQLVGKRNKKRRTDPDTVIKTMNSAMNSASVEYVNQHMKLKKLAWLASRKGNTRDACWARAECDDQRAALHFFECAAPPPLPFEMFLGHICNVSA